jgi:hypothetical protein
MDSKKSVCQTKKKLYENESEIEKKWKIENRKIITSNRKWKNQG